MFLKDCFLQTRKWGNTSTVATLVDFWMFTFIQELSQETFCHQPQLGDFNARGRRSPELNKNENVLPDLCIKADIFIILTKRNKCWLNEWNPPHLHSCYDQHFMASQVCKKMFDEKINLLDTLQSNSACKNSFWVKTFLVYWWCKFH